jgi:tRNA(Ile)-lysidine synthase
MPPGDFETRMLATIQRWGMLPPGIRIGVAVSGGADSVALFRTLHGLANQRGWELVVLHVNHHLRGAESDADADFVRGLAAQMGSFCQTADLPLTAPGNIEQQGREARYHWFRELVQSGQVHRIALGHTLSDQAETVLFRFLRGSGGAGLAAIRPVTTDGFVRPLIDLTRQEIRAQLCTIGQNWRDDSSNSSLSLDRNRIRLELLPQLARDWNPRIETTLAATAEWARAEEEYWVEIVNSLAGRYLKPRRDAQICPIEPLQTLPVAASRRLIRHAIRLVRGDLHSIDFTHVEQIRALARRPYGDGRILIPGVDVMRSFEWLRLAPPGSYGGERHFSAPVGIPGQISLPESDFVLMLQVQNEDYRYNEVVHCLDGDLVSSPLELRTWQPGDQYRQAGHPSVAKLKTLFQEARIPLWERRTWPVLSMGGAIVWSRGFGAAAEFAAGPETRVRISVAERPISAATGIGTHTSDVYRS